MADRADRRRGGGIAFAVVSIFAFIVIVSLIVMSTQDNGGNANPFAGRTLFTYAHSSAAKAEANASDPSQQQAFATLADTPTAIWLLPEKVPTAEVTEYVAKIQAAAAVENELPVYVVYGIPSRDCGNYSAGGADDAEYPLWVSAIAVGLGSQPAVVILEPDALALAPSCGTEQASTAFLRDAIKRLNVESAISIYLDGGHSNWIPAETMAPLLQESGVSSVRGFATNVSNYNTTEEERAYAENLSELLGGAHYVIDVGRNGNGSTGEWCNPPGRKLGTTPSGVVDGSALDANLWIKNPGESDGECNGGPPAGQWWPEQALELVRGH